MSESYQPPEPERELSWALNHLQSTKIIEVQTAFEILYRRCPKICRNLLICAGLSDADRDEVIQRTLLALYNHDIPPTPRAHEGAAYKYSRTSLYREALRLVKIQNRHVAISDTAKSTPDVSSTEVDDVRWAWECLDQQLVPFIKAQIASKGRPGFGQGYSELVQLSREDVKLSELFEAERRSEGEPLKPRKDRVHTRHSRTRGRIYANLKALEGDACERDGQAGAYAQSLEALTKAMCAWICDDIQEFHQRVGLEAPLSVWEVELMLRIYNIILRTRSASK